MGQHDVRWRQRFDSYLRAVQTLTDAAAVADHRALSTLEEQGVIQGFEFTHELAWNLLKDFLASEGHVGLMGSRSATRKAFEQGLIEDGDTWMAMIDDRNLTSHTYDEALARRIATDALRRYYPEFTRLVARFAAIRDRGDGGP